MKLTLMQIGVITFAIVIAVLCWSPWLSNDFVLKQYTWKMVVPGALNAEDAARLTSVSFDSYEVSWTPFGRLVKIKDDLACGFLESTTAYNACAAKNKPSYVGPLGIVIPPN